MEEYINFSYKYTITDWSKSLKERYNVTYIPTRKCVFKDFGLDEKSRRAFDSWYGIPLHCPSVTDFELLGDPSSEVSKALSFEVTKCKPENRVGKTPCK